jgi:hypothetical protein
VLFSSGWTEVLLLLWAWLVPTCVFLRPKMYVVFRDTPRSFRFLLGNILLFILCVFIDRLPCSNTMLVSTNEGFHRCTAPGPWLPMIALKYSILKYIVVTDSIPDWRPDFIYLRIF